MPTSEQQNQVNWFLNNSDLSPEIRKALTEQFDSSRATPEQLVNRYKAVADISEGAKPLSDLLRSLSGNQDRYNQYIYETFRSTLGRDPSANEFAQALPYFSGVNGQQTGTAYLAELADQYKTSPEYIRSQAGQYSDDVTRIFQDTYGRAPTADELQYFGTQVAGGQDPYALSQQLKNSQEYQTAQDAQFRSGLASELEGYDTKFFDKAKEGIYSRAARQGGGVAKSSALDFALTNLLGDIADKRSQYLSGLSAQQYGGNKEAARGDYLTQQNRYFQEQDYNKNLRQSELDYYRNRSDQNTDFKTQQDSYYDQLGRRNQSRNVMHGADWINSGINLIAALR